MIAQVQTSPPGKSGLDLESLDQGFDWLRTFGWTETKEWWDEKFTSSQVGTDLLMVVGSVVVSLFVAWMLRRFFSEKQWPWLLELRSRLKPPGRLPVFPALLSVVLWGAVLLTNALELSCPITRTASLLVLVYAVTKFPTYFINRSYWIKPVSVIIFVAAVLHVLGLLGTSVELLDSLSIQLGSVRLSAFDLVMGPLVLLTLLGAAGLLTGLADRRLKASQNLPPAVMVMVGKVIQLTAMTAAVVVTLQVVGIDLTTLTVFGGALGLGLGFGMQKVVSNLVCGVVLLMDKSVKPGDVVEIGGTYGWVNSMRMRYVSVITRDNKEYLMPNEDLITQPVVNWSFSNRLVRLKASIGISYDSDVHQAIDICITAATNNERVSNSPGPKCLLMGFGDNAIELQLRFWIEDPDRGTKNVTSEILLEIWDRFKQEGIEIPFPQRDLHLKTATPIQIDSKDQVDRISPSDSQ